MLIDGHDLDKITNEINEVLAKYNLEIVNCTGVFESPTRFKLSIKEFMLEIKEKKDD